MSETFSLALVETSLLLDKTLAQMSKMLEELEDMEECDVLTAENQEFYGQRKARWYQFLRETQDAYNAAAAKEAKRVQEAIYQHKPADVDSLPCPGCGRTECSGECHAEDED